MSVDGARAAFVSAFYELVSPKVKQIAGDVEVRADALVGGSRDGVIVVGMNPLFLALSPSRAAYKNKRMVF